MIIISLSLDAKSIHTSQAGVSLRPMPSPFARIPVCCLVTYFEHTERPNSQSKPSFVKTEMI